MACAMHGTVGGAIWHAGTTTIALPASPLFAANDNGDIDYRAIASAAYRLWRDHGEYAPQLAVTRAQAAFWQGRMATCRWWHSVARMLDRALVAGAAIAPPPAGRGGRNSRRNVPANA